MVTAASLVLALVVADVPPVRPAPVPERGVLPVAAAVVPGILLHGSGHYAAGDRPTAWRLFRAESLGVGLMVVGLAGLAATGASDRTIEPLIWTTAAGGGLFATSWLGDLYGVIAPPGGVGLPLLVLPSFEAHVGTRFVGDPTLEGQTFLGPGLDLRFGRWRVSPGAWFAMDGASNSRYEVEAAFRFVGPRAGAAAVPVVDGSFFDLVVQGIHHRYRDDPTGPLLAAFDMTTGELRVEGRYDLRRYAPSLTGSFVEAGAGVGIGGYHYPAAATTETNTMLLARFGFGLYVGRRADAGERSASITTTGTMTSRAV